MTTATPVPAARGASVERRGAPRAHVAPALSNELLGTLYFLAAETMFFLGLVFAAIHLHHARPIWPPPESPPLDIGLLVFNSAVLLGSSVTLICARRALGAGGVPNVPAVGALGYAGCDPLATTAGVLETRNRARFNRWLGATILLGTLFLAGQAVEFARLGGRQPTESLYRTLFDVIAGLHGLHVAAGLVILAILGWRIRLGQVTAARPVVMVAATWYWFFVTAVWLSLLATLLHIS